VTYHHKSGLYAEGSIGWVSRPTSGPDDESLAAGYEFTLSSILEGSLSYTHYWYSASSTKPQAVTNQSVAGMLTLGTRIISMVLNLSDDFGGGGSEFTASLDVSKEIVLSERAFGGSFTISPAVAATWGQQNEKLMQRRVQRTKKKVVIRISGQPETVFGIIDYELSLPAELRVGNLSFQPAVEYIIPANVLNGKTTLNKDPSTSIPFVNVNVTVSLTVR
jgi:hypothetical protein